MQIQGPDGELRHGYFRAATLGPWHFTGTKRSGTFTAALRSSDAFRLSQTPLRIVVHAGRETWTWPVISLQMTPEGVTATVGEKG